METINAALIYTNKFLVIYSWWLIQLMVYFKSLVIKKVIISKKYFVPCMIMKYFCNNFLFLLFISLALFTTNGIGSEVC